MDGNGHYPSPNFDCPPPKTFMMPPASQHPAHTSNFHPSMWNWNETHSESDPWARNVSHDSRWQCEPLPTSGNYDGRYDSPAGPGHHQHGQHFNRGWHRGRGYNRGQQNNYGKKQKFKKEPEYPYFCDTCDRGFKTQETHSEHMAQHIKCSVPDCNFTAHEKIVAIHWRNSHAPGAKRIKLDTQDEIEKWREERRRNYPTVGNIEKKRKTQDVREEGGGVLETAQFGRMRGRGRGRGRGGARGRNWFHSGAPGGPQYHGNGPPERAPPLLPATRDGDPLGALVNDDPDSDKEERSGTSKQGGLVVAPKQMSAGLGSLVANYGSLTESDSEEEPKTLPIQRAGQLVQENQARTPNLPRGPQDKDAPLGSHPRASPQGPYRGRGRGRGGRGRRGGSHMTPEKRATLLEMLLAPDIRHERNVLLQCVRYVVRNAFFGLESEPQDQRPHTKGEGTEPEGQGVAGGAGPSQSACVANEGAHQTKCTETAAMSTQAVLKEEPQVDALGTSEMEDEKSGTTEIRPTSINLSGSKEEKISGNAECVPMAEALPSDNDVDIATTTTEEIPTGVYDDEIWEY